VCLDSSVSKTNFFVVMEIQPILMPLQLCLQGNPVLALIILISPLKIFSVMCKDFFGGCFSHEFSRWKRLIQLNAAQLFSLQ